VVSRVPRCGLSLPQSSVMRETNLIKGGDEGLRVARSRLLGPDVRRAALFEPDRLLGRRSATAGGHFHRITRVEDTDHAAVVG
jgi:hypothetical protein